MALKDNDKVEVMKEIFMLITRLAKMYQIPGFDNTNAELLAEWVFEEYQHHELELVQEALRKPPVLNDPAWRLTPDTLKVWIDLKRSERVEYQQKVESLMRQKDSQPDHGGYTEKVNKLIEDYKKELKEGFVPVAPLTEKEIKEEGQTRPKKPTYIGPAMDYVNEWRKKMMEYQERTVRERHPEWNEEQILARLKELERTL